MEPFTDFMPYHGCRIASVELRINACSQFGNAQSGSSIYENSSSALLAPFPSETKLRELGIGSFLVETKRSPELCQK